MADKTTTTSTLQMVAEFVDGDDRTKKRSQLLPTNF